MKRIWNTPRFLGRLVAYSMASLFTLVVFAADPVAVGKGLDAKDPKPKRIGKGKVNATTLLVRGKPGTQHAIVHTLKNGAEIDLIQKKFDWYEIAAPEDMTVWVAGNLIVDGVAAKDVNMRSGPGVNHASLGLLKAGSKVKPLKVTRHGWMNIFAPSEVTGWVSADYVDVVKPIQVKTPKPKVSVKPKPKTVVTNQFPKIKELPFVKGDEKDVSVEGFLYPAKSDFSYVTHVVGLMAGGDFLPLFYVHGDSVDLVPYERKLVRITGTRRRVKGWKLPVVDAFTIVETAP